MRWWRKPAHWCPATRGAEDSYITSCASAGIAIAVAAAITHGDRARVALMPDSTGMANEVVMLRGQNVDYGAPVTSAIRLGGGRIVEVGSSNLAARWQLESAMTKNTAALLYVKSHHCVQKGMLSIDDFVQVAQANHLPLIVDAAAEEDLRGWVASGADMVIYSGAKAFNAPTSGFITGKKTWIAACKAQHQGIARAMKIGKEKHGWAGVCAGELPPGPDDRDRSTVTAGRGSDFRHPWGFMPISNRMRPGVQSGVFVCG
ncbi:transferase [Salmonella bongori]|nr:transferase [Salmonella bongori]